MSTLGLLFTEGISLDIWVSQGLFSREKQIYEEHLKRGHFDKIIWFTYGRNDKVVYEKLLKEKKIDERIIVVPRPQIFIGGHLMHLYSYLLPYIQRKYCKEIDIIKTNQMGGAWTGSIIQKKHKKPFLLRTGYTYSALYENKLANANTKREKYKTIKLLKKYQKIEKKLYLLCDFATVSSNHDREYICDSYMVSTNKIEVVPNYIDCDIFKSYKPWSERKKRFLFVGRLSEEKNLFNTIQAIGELGIGLDIYGKGDLRSQLEELAQQNSYDICFKGTLANHDLPNIYNDYCYYVLASPFEGMSKTLLEAMACGVLCFGTNTSGIKEIISDGINGYLIPDTSVQSIKNTIQMGINANDYQKLTENAAQQIYNKNSLQSVTDLEWEIIQRITNLKRR